MPKANSHHTPDPSRRAVIRGGGKVAAALAVLAGATAAAAPAPAVLTGDDAEIVALGREVFRCEAITGSDAAIGRAVDVMASASRRIASLKATTFAALAVKLRIAAIDLLPFDPDEFYPYDQLNLLSAITDAERLAEVQA